MDVLSDARESWRCSPFSPKRSGVEERFFIKVGDARIGAVQEGDIERTREDGKTSSVHFLHFPMTDAEIAAFRDASTEALIGCDHPLYAHLAALGEATRAELAKDLA